MRAFVFVGHTQPVTPEFSLDDLPGDGGRIDVLCRNLTAALLVSHGIRADVSVWLVIRDEVTIEVRGDEVRNLRPDERSTGALLRSALTVAQDRAVSRRPVESSPGIYVRRQGLSETIRGLAADHDPVRLAPDAAVLEPNDAPDHQPLRPPEVNLLDDHGAKTKSIGPRVVHGDHTVAIAHNVCDRAEAIGESGD